MNRKLAIYPAFLLTMLVGSCAPPLTITSEPPQNSKAITSAQSTVDALASVQPSGAIPDHFTIDYHGDVVRNEDDFDVNVYFGALTHLSMEPGYVLDYLYQMDGLGGAPFIYARPVDRMPYASLDEYADSRDYLSHIKTDDTREAYFQFVALMIMDGQFYLYWHAAYNDTTIVCEKDSLERTMSAAGSAFGGSGLPTSVQSQARKLDLTPTVEFPDDSTAIVRVVTFSKWGGFAESRYAVSRRFPHTLVRETAKTMIEYDCGVQF
jgi:hypothetical protein